MIITNQTSTLQGDKHTLHNDFKKENAYPSTTDALHKETHYKRIEYQHSSSRSKDEAKEKNKRSQETRMSTPTHYIIKPTSHQEHRKGKAT
jgi:hypothetical protein